VSRTVGHGGPGTRGRESWARWRRVALVAEYPWLADVACCYGDQALRVACWVLDQRLPRPPETWCRAFGLTLGVIEPSDKERERWDSARDFARRTGEPAGLLGSARWAPLHPRAHAAISATLSAADCAGWHTDGVQRVLRHRGRRCYQPAARN
jgi:hypothetical protein